MSLDLEHAELAPLAARLTPYARELLARAGRAALAIHADEVTPEHLLCVLMEDEESAAYQAVEHAFADPDTLRLEALAIAPGVLVVASGSTSAFSTRAVRALARARAEAAALGVATVTPARILACSVGELEGAARAALEDAGLQGGRLAAQAASEAAAESPVPAEGPLFRHFSAEAKRALSGANRLAAEGGLVGRIAPGHLVLALLQAEPDLVRAAGLAYLAARAALGGRLDDPTPPPERRLAPDPELLRFLGGLEPGAGSLALLSAVHARGSPELRHILTRNKVTAELVERARTAFEDP